MAHEGSISLLPTEIWHIILRYSISVPGFLDPDDLVDRFPPWVINSRDWSDPKFYYKTESVRNTLQRVCRVWDEYLRSYAHRYVRMIDVVHGMVPAHYLRSALRVSFQGHDFEWCDSCKPELLPRQYNNEGYLSFWYFFLRQAKPFKTEILEYGPSEYNLMEEFISPLFFPDLVRIHAMDEAMSPEEVIMFAESIPSFRHMYTELIWYEGELFSLKSSTLTTLILSFSIPNTSSMLFTDKSLQLPALRHLHIEDCTYEQPNEYEEPAWLPLLRITGKELRTLFLPYEVKCTKGDVPKEIWSLCPKLEDLCLQSGFIIPPPIGHPIHTLGLPQYRVSHENPLEDCVPYWPGLHTVRITNSWEDWMKDSFGPLTSSQLKWLHSRRIRLEDQQGEPYTEYISRTESKEGVS
jgi:hypothetical protein